MGKIEILYLCVHNSCRSQIAEALTNHFYGDYFIAYSAGTSISKEINSDAVRILKNMYKIDMLKNQKPKLIDNSKKVDLIVTMGCNVICPTVNYECDYIDFNIEDPTGKSDLIFEKTIEEIKNKIDLLIKDLYGF